MKNWMKFKIISVGTCRLIIDIRFKLYLHDVFYVPSVFRNLVSLSKLDLEGFSFIFMNSNFKLMKNFILVGTGTLCNALYKINLDSFFFTIFTCFECQYRNKMWYCKLEFFNIVA